MKPFDFISVKLCSALILGILIGRLLEISIFSAFLILIVFLFILLLFLLYEPYRTGIYFGISAFLAASVLGVLVVALSQPRLWTDHYSNTLLKEEPLWELRVSRMLKSNSFSDRFLLDVRTVNGKASSGTLLARIRKDTHLITCEVDDILLYKGRIHPISPPANPHQFAYDTYMETLGVYHQIELTEDTILKRLKGKHSVKGKAAAFRTNIISALEKTSLGRNELDILQAILLGQRNNLDPDIYEDYQQAGAAHILAVSGLHIGILLLLLQALLKPLLVFRHGSLMRMSLIIITLWAYAFFTGLSPSVVRAVTMFSFVSYALFLNRPTSIANILALSAFAVLLINPMFLFQVGFQMSYAAVFAIVWIYPILQKIWNPRFWFLKKTWQLFSVSLAAQAGVLPISIYYFNQFPGLFFLSNLLIVPFLGIILGMGILVILLSICDLLPVMVAQTYNTLLKSMNTVVKLIADQEQFLFNNLSLDVITVIFCYLLLYFVVRGLEYRNARAVIKIAVCVLTIQSWTFYRAYCSSQNEQLMVLHKMADTVILHQEGRRLHVMTSDSTKVNQLLSNIALKEFLGPVTYRDVPNAFTFNGQTWIVIDSSGVFPSNTVQSAVLLLTQSPHIHLDRLLAHSKPQMVVADGSNYRADVARWKKSCESSGLPFHATSEKGAFRLRPD